MPAIKKRKLMESDLTSKNHNTEQLESSKVADQATDEVAQDIHEQDVSDIIESPDQDPSSPKETESKKTFEDLGLSKWLIETLQSLSITHPTEIQSACVPSILEGTNENRLSVDD